MSLTQQEREAIAIANCDEAPIHIPGSIQSFGFLVGLDLKCSEFVYVSENINEFLAFGAHDLLDQPPSEIFSHEILHSINNTIGRSTSGNQRLGIGELNTDRGICSLSAHVKMDTIILEGTLGGDIPTSHTTSFDRLRWLLGKINYNASVQEILDDAVDYLKDFLGYDRVMAYRFRPDGSGEVVAEQRDHTIESFLGLRFPEFDIPKQARKLYINTPLRIIGNVSEKPIPLISKPDMPDLDMSLSLLRGTAPVHIQYLENMGVQASMSIPLVVEGKLWGLFAFHHKTPRFIGGGIDIAIEFAGQYLNMVLNAAIMNDINKAELKSVKIANSLFTRLPDDKSAKMVWLRIKDQVKEIIPSDGVIFKNDNSYHSFGMCPPHSLISDIEKKLTSIEANISISEDLPAHFSQAQLGNVAGALKVSFDDKDETSIIFFRQSASTAVDWAGSPTKELYQTDHTYRLSPRGSFKAFSKEMQGQSESWENQDITAIRGLQKALAYAHNEMIERDDLVESLSIVVQELNHRVNNILTLVQSIIKQTKSGDGDTKSQFAALEGRIFSLANAHGILSQNSRKSLNIADALKQEAKPYPSNQIDIYGPQSYIKQSAATIFTLVMHEMLSNCAKYGALSEKEGRLTISWETVATGLEISWSESGGPSAKKKREGFGLGLIENAFSYEFNGDADLSFTPQGLKAKFFIPHEILDMDHKSKQTLDISTEKAIAFDKSSNFFEGTVLIVEDEFLVAQQTLSHIEDLGVEKCVIAPSVERALQILDNEQITHALVDINLSGSNSNDVALKLIEKQIPFVFLSGYSEHIHKIKALESVTLLQKPTSAANIKQAFQKLLEI